jgi:bifunctional non-homologous end joining protein LigD
MARTTSQEKPKTVLKKALADERPVKSKGLVRAKRTQAPARKSPGKGDLAEYRTKRDFSLTPEPTAKKGKDTGNRFCVQKHAARRLHYDLRLELDGVLKSWAVTKGPSLIAGEKRLAVHTEDHPMEYLTFEGVIPAGEYGGGTMIVWDRGTWQAEGNPREAYRRGRLTFALDGERLHGRWHLVRTRMKPGEKKEQWLLFKSDDEHARDARAPDVVAEFETSVITGKTNDDLAAEAAGEPVAAKSEPEARAKPAAKPKAPALKAKGAKAAPLPDFIEPALAKLCTKAPNGPNWLHEIKFDGYRIQARIEGGKVALLTRKGLDWTHKFGPVGKALAGLGLDSAVIDGELVVEDEGGVSSFSALQQALTAGTTGRMIFYAFDLLYLDGSDLREAALSERKKLLQLALDDLPAGGPLRFSEHIAEDGQALVRHACRMGLEGIVSKRADQPYRSGRSEAWLKTKCALRQEFVVAGYVPSTTSRKAIGSLVLGVYDKGRLIHVGRVGTGYTMDVARKLWEQLHPTETATQPFPDRLPREAVKDAKWVRPELVAEVEFRGWTHDGSVRQASFKGLREDKDPQEIVRETAPAPGAEEGPDISQVRLTHPDRVLWEDEGITKRGLAEFYAEIADWVLPHLVNRPLALVRCPSGSQKECFFQKHSFAGLDETAVTPVDIGDDHVLAIHDLKGLLQLVQASVLEIHPWGSTLKDVEKPDRITFDLDPDEGLDWNAVVAATMEVRERLSQLKLDSFVKTTGGKGLHVVVPLKPQATWDEVKAFCESIAVSMARDSPDKYTAVLSKKARAGRIFVDYLRNGRGATAVAAYSTRARAGAPVSAPIDWSELPTLRSGGQFRVATLPGRLRHLARDPWDDLWASEQTLPRPPRVRKTR